VEQLEILDRIAGGETQPAVTWALGNDQGDGRQGACEGGWQAVSTLAGRRRSPLALSLIEREEIRAGIAAGDSFRAIARRLGGAPSTLSREVGGVRGRNR
jgi:Helix-turn-helix domain